VATEKIGDTQPEGAVIGSRRQCAALIAIARYLGRQAARDFLNSSAVDLGAAATDRTPVRPEDHK
jgi:hypothetical protein